MKPQTFSALLIAAIVGGSAWFFLRGGVDKKGGGGPPDIQESTVTVVAPAIGNAIFNAVGARLRHIPITPAAVKAAMA